ncbi:hydroxyacid oxidase 2-like isoform X2 [Lytechinus variegatus]|uniref:hydroxyacid oxidase 2-like isoform X2 n=1 Tax=Lytechinus variegatus TaxID=7654 RepID=UPI001BB23F81|nr:hydroxyacid oxidase 2-like isoform X2 [Lytechinus variegatus]
MGLYSLFDYERQAKETLNKTAWEYINYGRERKWCFHDSIQAFSRYRIRSRVLQDVSKRCLATTVLGQSIPYPICISPTASHYYAHPDAERATAKGAEAAKALMILSCDATCSMDDVTEAAPEGLRWMNIYPFADRQLTEYTIRKAEKLGFKAIVVTVDSPVPGIDGAVDELLYGVTDPLHRMPIYDVDIPSARAADQTNMTNHWKYVDEQLFNPKATWEDIRWMKKITSLPIVCKGILTAESASDAARAGVDGILVSAHGGRQLESSPAPIDALSEVVEAVRDQGIEVYMDGGVRTGTDVFKALGRGARAVFLGRPILWGLACQGPAGVKEILDILRKQLDTILALAGVAQI